VRYLLANPAISFTEVRQFPYNGSRNGNTVVLLIEYRMPRSFLISADDATPVASTTPGKKPLHLPAVENDTQTQVSLSRLDEEFMQQENLNSPKWAKWPEQKIETSIGDIRQWGNEIAISYSVLNSSDQPVEIVPPQIQIAGRKVTKKRRRAKALSRINWRFGSSG
jgi:hypothetical protein